MGGEGPLPDAVRDRLRAHVDAIVGAASLRPTERLDVAEELTGHLEEAYRAGLARGETPEDAATGAIATFGAAEPLAHELMRTYRGPLWASTIGQLLPVANDPTAPPGIVLWLARFDRLIALLTAITAAVLLATEAPLRAVLGGFLGAFSAVVIALAATALRRGQVWGSAVSAFVCFVNALIFFALIGQPAGGWTVSLNGLAGLILLLGIWGNLGVLDAWTVRSGRIPLRIGLPVAVGLVGWELVSGFPANVPDPTQIGPNDVRAAVTVTCAPWPGAAETGAPPVLVPSIELRVTYDRVDAWPHGFLRDPSSWGDAIEVDAGPLFYSAPGDVQAFGTTANGTEAPVDVSMWADMPDSIASAFGPTSVAGEILGSDQRPGRTIRVIVPMQPVANADDPSAIVGAQPGSVVAQVRLYHLDRFWLQAFPECGTPVTLLPHGV